MTAPKQKAAPRQCECGATLGLKNRLGSCRRCRARMLSADPAIVARRTQAATERFRSDPDVRARHKAACIEGTARRMAKPGERERMRRVGLMHGLPNLVATQTPESRAAAAEATRRRHIPWCPPEYYAFNQELKAKGFLAAERKAIILAEVPGTAEHAKRVVANHLDAQRIRAERDKAQAY